MPGEHDDQHLDSGRRTSAPQPNLPQTLLGVLGHALDSWGMTARLVVVLVVCIGLLVGGLWLLDATVTAGPPSDRAAPLGRRQTNPSSSTCSPTGPGRLRGYTRGEARESPRTGRCGRPAR